MSRWLAQLDAKVSCVVPGATESEVEVQDWLAKLSLLDFWQPLHALGVTSFDDFEFVEKEDLVKMGMKPVQRRKFFSAVDKLLKQASSGMDYQDNVRAAPAKPPPSTYQNQALSLGSFPYAVPPHLHPKWGETKDLVVDKFMTTPLGELRSFFKAEANVGSNSGDAQHDHHRSQPQSQPQRSASKSEIANEASAVVTSMEDMAEALDLLGVDIWSMSIGELMAMQDLALEESGLRGPDLDTDTQRAIRAFRAGDIIESQRLFDKVETSESDWSARNHDRRHDEDSFQTMEQRRVDGGDSHGGTGETSKENVDALFQRGMDFLETGDFGRAAESFSAVLLMDGTHTHAKHNLGVARAQASSLSYIKQHDIPQGTSLSGILSTAITRALKLLGATEKNTQNGTTVFGPQQSGESPWLFIELGVFQGHSLRRIASFIERYSHVVHGFDSWQGLPGPFAGITPAGAFSTHGRTPTDLPRNVRLHSGWLNTSMPAFVEQQSTLGNALRRAAFIHVDVDLYSSTMDGLAPLARAGMLVPGTILLFDEYFGWPGWDLDGVGEASAWKEICLEYGIRWRHVLAYKQRMVIEVL